MTRSNSHGADAAGLVRPELLIFFHMPKTGGTTMDFILKHCFAADQLFSAFVGVPESAISVGSRGKIAAKYNLLAPEAKRSIRCVMGGHMRMGIHTLFDRPAKYFTIVRHPIDRVISEFYYSRGKSCNPHYELIKNMALEQYMDSRIGLDPFDLQVRMLSGCKELDGPWGLDGKPVPAAPVEARHLEIAKQNVEEHFLAAAPLEEFSSLVVLLKRLYGWRLRKNLYEIQYVTASRPHVAELCPATIRRIEDCNQHDMALYEWIKSRFARQVRALGPQFSLDRLLFNTVNSGWQKLVRKLPEERRRKVLELLYL